MCLVRKSGAPPSMLKSCEVLWHVTEGDLWEVPIRNNDFMVLV